MGWCACSLVVVYSCCSARAYFLFHHGLGLFCSANWTSISQSCHWLNVLLFLRLAICSTFRAMTRSKSEGTSIHPMLVRSKCFLKKTAGYADRAILWGSLRPVHQHFSYHDST
ncbi:hypothetical protein BDV32DRAFT_121451 [Aspergillus pseudonomiae]|uniref:Uncharacterized protein n=1 Tax=Aspergillus pseudonomiae TaxID=1506151 RepID=A0A5N7CVW5_9EURO|nr:uncharacterized protein BDV37DRAFT_264219 [Aspergillus pseudonomiae]KAB8261533.1 hypothetical protein BDV32DRAFT_121451 [Aspergillus pseudonomiae]KAE8398119.1 hypothetical protein BDV37DRAFT_264219 [Aspergillus pseudonomiae]